MPPLLPLLVPALSLPVVPIAVFRAYGIPIDWKAQLRWAAFAGIGVFVAELLASSAFGEPAGPIVGLGTNLLLAVVTVVRARAYAHLNGLVEALTRADADATSRVDAQIARWAPLASAARNKVGADAWTLRFVERAIVSGRSQDALRWLDALPAASLAPALSLAATQYRASACLRLGDKKGARAALASIARPAGAPDFELALQALEALLDVLDGADVEARVDAALASATLPPGAKSTWLMARAHALAARHADEEARALLTSLDADVLARIVRHAGPASTLAERVLAKEGPYR